MTANSSSSKLFASEDRSSVLYTYIPLSAHPTQALADRFEAWRRIVRSLVVYFNQLAQYEEERVRQHSKLIKAVNFPFLTDSSGKILSDLNRNNVILNGTLSTSGANNNESTAPEMELISAMFLEQDKDSISAVPARLSQYHRHQANNSNKLFKELSQSVVPRLEDLRRDLGTKIKEIHALAGDFKNSVSKEQQQTWKEIQTYNNAIQTIGKDCTLLSPKLDPYLLKISLDKQLHHQINEEHYLHDAFINLQSSGRELEKVVSEEVQNVISIYAKYIGNESNIVADHANRLLQGYASADPTTEWDDFITRNKNFIDPTSTARRSKDIKYPNQYSPLVHEIHSGYLERRSKYLKSYSRAWYVLTPTFLHEFKSSDRRKDLVPVMSLSLADCKLTLEDKSKSKSGSQKFILNAKQEGSHKGHNWVFRAESDEKLQEWFNYLKAATSIVSPIERALRYSKGVISPSVSPSPEAQEIKKANDLAEGDSLSVSQSIKDKSGSYIGGSNSLLNVNGASERASRLSIYSQETSKNSLLSKAFHQQEEQESSQTHAEEEPHIHHHHQHNDHEEQSQHQQHRSFAAAALSKLSTDDHGSTVSGYDSLVSPGSIATSTGEPYNHGRKDEELSTTALRNSSSNYHRDSSGFERENEDRGKFTADVKYDKYPKNVDDDDSGSLFSYDYKIKTDSSIPKDKDFVPVDADLPIKVERELYSSTDHKKEIPEIIIAKDADEDVSVFLKHDSAIIDQEGRNSPILNGERKG